MDVRSFCTQSRVLIVAGKGGVGKTTMVATMARMAAGAGLSALVVELEGRPGVPDAFGHAGELEYDEAVLEAAGARGIEAGVGDDGAAVASGTVRARRITPDEALAEYLAEHGLKRVSKRLASSGLMDVVAGAIPGLRDILVLGKIKQLERDGVADVILVDAPATGHAMTFLTSASGLLDAARGGPVRAQAADVVELLTDPDRCQVVLVTLPEEMPVNEAIEAAYRIEDEVGVALGPVIVNGCYDDIAGLDVPAGMAAAEVAATGRSLSPAAVDALDRARSFRQTRQALQAEQIDRLGRELPLPVLLVPFAFTDRIGPDELGMLSTSLAVAVDGLSGPGRRPVAGGTGRSAP